MAMISSPVPVHEGKDPFIFISYSHHNSEQALRFIRLLYERGYRVWYDNGLVAGDPYNGVISKQISKCAVFIGLLSKDYAKSSNCCKEMHYAFADVKKPSIIPVYLQERKSVFNSLPSGIRLLLTDIQFQTFLPEKSGMPLLEELGKAKNMSKCLDLERIHDPEEQYQTGLSRYLAREYQEAEVPLLAAAKLEHVQAATLLGEIFLLGKGRKPDPKEASVWLRFSAEQGNARAECLYGDYLFIHEPGHEKEALLWYGKAAEHGHPEAQYKLGYFYYLGKYVLKDVPKALTWFEAAAAANYADAEYQLGYMYKNGFGVKQDPDMAREWLGLAAGHGNEKAQAELMS